MAILCPKCTIKETMTNLEVTDEQTLLEAVQNGHLWCMNSLIRTGIDEMPPVTMEILF